MFTDLFLLFVLTAQLFSAGVGAQKADALVPNYVYPLNTSSWLPLYYQIGNHTDLIFTVVINPSSGPGSEVLPNPDYQRELWVLRQYANVRIIGYVDTAWVGWAPIPGGRDLSLVKADIDIYAGWRVNSSNTFWLDGVFFDDAPSENNSTMINYMQEVTSYVRNKAEQGFSSTSGSSTSYVVSNPGTPPQTAAYLNAASLSPDLVLVEENTYADFVAGEDWVNTNVGALNANGGQLAVMLHDMPTTAGFTCQNVTALAQGLKVNTGVLNLWFTDSSDYQVWPSSALFSQSINSFEASLDACA